MKSGGEMTLAHHQRLSPGDSRARAPGLGMAIVRLNPVRITELRALPNLKEVRCMVRIPYARLHQAFLGEDDH